MNPASYEWFSRNGRWLESYLTLDDYLVLDSLETGWFLDAEPYIPVEDQAIAEMEWNDWRSRNPEGFRLLAYYTRFLGEDQDIPMVLWEADGWGPDTADPALGALFMKVSAALAERPEEETAADPAGVPSAGKTSTALMIGLGIASLLLISRRR